MYIGGNRQGDGSLEQRFTPNGGHNLMLLTPGASVNRDIPYVTKATKLEVVNEATKPNSSSEGGAMAVGRMRTNFKPQGCLFALNFENKTTKEVIIQSINREGDNGVFYYSGFFSMASFENGAWGDSKEPKNIYTEPEYDVPFTGDTNSPAAFEVFSGVGNNDRIRLAKDAVSSGRVYLWGYPDEAKKNDKYVLKVNFAYADAPNTTIASKSISFKAPTKGWTSGTCYRATLKIAHTPPARPSVASNGINPLAFVAEYNINTDGTGFATDHTSANSGYFTWAQANNIAAKTAGYTIPSIWQWRSIFSRDADVNWLYGTFSETTCNVKVGENEVAECKSDFKLSDGVTYGMRYKGNATYASAWSYERDDTDGTVIIKCLTIEPDKTVDDVIDNKDIYFTDPKCVTRVFAANGRKESASAAPIGLNSFVNCWSSDKEPNRTDQVLIFSATNFALLKDAVYEDDATNKHPLMNLRLFKTSL